MFDPIRSYDKPEVILTQLANGIATTDSVRRVLFDPAALSPRERESFKDKLKAEFGGEVVPLLKLLEQDGLVVAVALEWWFAREAVVELLRRLRGSVRVGERYTPSELREGMGLTRKWLIPFLEWCDRRGLARRVESGRIFREVPGEP